MRTEKGFPKSGLVWLRDMSVKLNYMLVWIFFIFFWQKGKKHKPRNKKWRPLNSPMLFRKINQIKNTIENQTIWLLLRLSTIPSTFNFFNQTLHSWLRAHMLHSALICFMQDVCRVLTTFNHIALQNAYRQEIYEHSILAPHIMIVRV